MTNLTRIKTTILFLCCVAGWAYAQQDTLSQHRIDSVWLYEEQETEVPVYEELPAIQQNHSIRRALSPDTKIYVYVNQQNSTTAFAYSGNQANGAMVSLIAYTNPAVSGLYYRFEGYMNADMSDLPIIFTTQSNPYINAEYYLARWWRVRAATTKEGLDDPEQYIISELTHLDIFTDQDICRQGDILFKEDFGGNSPSDSRVRQDAVRGVFPNGDKAQTTDDKYHTQMGMYANSDLYLITKQGFAFGDTTVANPSSGWHIQDDHTYPGDMQRGYFLEVNGKLGSETVYSTTLDQLCAGTPLTFTAYIANVATSTYARRTSYYYNPRFRMAVLDADQDTVIREVETLDIPVNNSFSASWRTSSPWYLYGFPFVVPEGVSRIKFAIYNAVTIGARGVDYAIDDIEIRRCDAPIPVITSPTGALSGTDVTFTLSYDNKGFFTEPLHYRWQYSSNSWDWTDLDSDQNLHINAVTQSNAGYYRVLVGDAETITNENCCAISDKIYFQVVDNETQPLSEELHPDATCHVRNDFENEQGGVLAPVNPDNTTPLFTLDIDNIMPGLRYAFEALVANGGNGTQLQFVIKDPNSGYVLAIYETEVLTGSEWQLVGTTYTVPDYIFGLRLEVYDISTGTNRKPMIDYGAIRLVTPAITMEPSADAFCTANPFIALRGLYTDDGSLGSKRTIILEYSADSISWKQFYKGTGGIYSQRPENMNEGWYRASIARTADIDLPHCRAISQPVYMQKVEGGCTPFRHPWPDEISDDVCPRGTLLFREDFGGNDPSDPVTSKVPLTTMSSKYHQAFDVMSYVSQSWFIVSKRGWQNNLQTSKVDPLYSQWFVQDDHTYPNDYTRGYLLEVDGLGGNDAFYTTTFPVCHELDLSFSAYVANVLEPGHNLSRPKVRFLVTNELNGDTIWEQSTGAIEPAPADYGVNGPPIALSAPWHLVGASFHVPSDVSLIRLSIYNDENNSGGNDFAMDDIEIRLCKPEVSIESENEVCLDSAYTFQATVTTDGGFKQPYEYLWQFAKDSLPFNSDEWVNLKKGLDYSIPKATLENDGWYRLCVTSDGVDVETERYCRAMSEPFHLNVKLCCLDYETITADTVVCDTLMPFRWRDTLFTEPARYEIMYKNSRGCDSLLAILTLDTKICCPDVKTITADTVVCDTLMPFRWRDTLFTEPARYEIMYKNSRGCDSLLAILTLGTKLCCPDVKTITADTVVCDTLMPFRWRDTLFTEPARYEIMYKNSRGCDSLLAILTLDTKLCCPDVKTITADTVVCDTLMPFRWRDTLFTEPARYEIMYKNSRGCDSLLAILTLDTKLCCPDVKTITVDTMVCDTLIPFLWRGVLFTEPMEQTVMEYSPRGCDSILYSLAVDTFHCERLWLIIVNKYNWQLLCDNVALRSFFPGRTATGFQWFKNDQPVPGATEDDYAEQNELYGRFQLRVTLDGNQEIWSNIIELLDTHVELPIQVRIYNSRGMEIREDQAVHGIYLFRYKQGDNVWTEKKWIP